MPFRPMLPRPCLAALAALVLVLAACALIPFPAAPPTPTTAPPKPTAGAATALPTETAQPATPPASPSPTIPPTGTPDCVGAPGIGDPYFPALGNGGYDVQHYTLDLAVDMAASLLDATASIEAQATQELCQFNLDFHGFDIGAVTVNGQPASFAREPGELVVIPAETLGAGESFTVEVSYSGRPGEGVDRSAPQYSQGWQFYPGGALVAGEPTGASSWFPVNEHPEDKATYTFRIAVDSPFVVAANGTLAEAYQENGATTYVWEMTDPMAPYLTTVAIGDFVERRTTTAGGVTIRDYFAAGLAPEVIALFDRTPEMLDHFETLFGPYPFEVYGVVVHDLALNFALETQTLAIFGRSFIGETVIAHELAHMWFGNSVTITRWQDIWLNEGFATYASVLWHEYADGREAADREIELYYDNMTRVNLLLGDPTPDNLFDPIVYQRGALTLHALRLRVGDEAFFDILRAYHARFRHANATTDDFIAVAEAVSGESLGAFFHAWLFEEPLPGIPEMGLSQSAPGG